MVGTDLTDVKSLLLNLLSPLQRRFVLDPRRFKLARCTRRAGKTFAVAVYMIVTCLSRRRTPVLYAGLTRDSAKEAVWDILIGILDQLQIQYKPSPSTLQIAFPNGSKITLFGCDAQNARNRLRGRKFKLVCFDETGFFASLDPLVYAVLPMLADLGGTLCLTSSPGELLQGLFYEADQGSQRDKWSRYQWTIHDNPLFQKAALDSKYTTRAEEELAIMLENQFQGNVRHPGYVREWLGQWVADNTTLVYPFTDENIRPLTTLPHQEHAVGISIGAWVNAIVVGRYSSYSRNFQLIESAAIEDHDLDAFATIVSATVEKYQATAVVVDVGEYSKEIVKDLRKRYQLPLVSMSDKDKSFHQKVFANDLKSNYITFPRLPICDEYGKIVKDSNGDEIKGQPNYQSNAALSLYRRIYQTHLQSYEPPLSEEERHIKQIEDARYDVEEPWYERYS